MSDRVAVLVDGDNVSADYTACIRSCAGAVPVVRVYGNATLNTRWHAAEGYRFIHAGTGKNATDMILSIDAMELALWEGFERIVIASSDGDFTHLATWLRELGVTMIGIGERGRRSLSAPLAANFNEWTRPQTHRQQRPPLRRARRLLDPLPSITTFVT